MCYAQLITRAVYLCIVSHNRERLLLDDIIWYPCTFVVTYCIVAIICALYAADAAAADNKVHAAAADKIGSARRRRR